MDLKVFKYGKGENMKLMEKWKTMKTKQKRDDIESFKQHPVIWRITIAVFACSFAMLVSFMIISGAYPLALVASIFAIWMGREYYKIYKSAHEAI